MHVAGDCVCVRAGTCALCVERSGEFGGGVGNVRRGVGAETYHPQTARQNELQPDGVRGARQASPDQLQGPQGEP